MGRQICANNAVHHARAMSRLEGPARLPQPLQCAPLLAQQPAKLAQLLAGAALVAIARSPRLTGFGPWPG